MQWPFRILLAANALMLAAAFLYKSPCEDPAGTGLRLGFAIFYAVCLAVVLLLYHFINTPWVRIPMLALLTLPLFIIAYGVWRSL